MSSSDFLLTIDNDNSFPHIKLFEKEQLKSVLTLEKLNDEYKNRIENKNFNVVISNVGKSNPMFENLQQHTLNLNKYKKDGIFFDMPFDYTETIGDDRLFQAYYIYKTIIQAGKSERVLFIDAGTFTTLDIISNNGFKGGFIAPGMQTFLNCYDHGAYLPVLNELNINTDKAIRIPHSTEDAILDSCLFFQKSFYKMFLEVYRDFDYFILTGGRYQKHKEIIMPMLKPETKIMVDPNLIHYSMSFVANVFLDYEKGRQQPQ